MVPNRTGPSLLRAHPHPCDAPGVGITFDDDDRLIGRILSRREVLTLFGTGGVALAIAACAPGGSSGASPGASGSSGAATPSATPAASVVASSGAATAGALPSCVVVPELTEGPYYVDVNLERSDIRPNTADGVVAEGAPLVLGWVVSQVDGDGCLPLEGAIVDVWHCDALGVYSGVQGSTGTDFLRGFQRTDADGVASFTTVYPGWYQAEPCISTSRSARTRTRRPGSSSPRSYSSTTR